MPAFRRELGIAEIEGRRRARLRSSNSGRVLGPGISVSKYASISACDSRYQRGKKVVSASSGKTTSSAPCPLASRSNAKRRATAHSRLLLRAMGPSCAAAMVSGRGTRRIILSSDIARMGSAANSEPCSSATSRSIGAHCCGFVRMVPNYCIGAVLLDRDDPRRVIGRLHQPLLEPLDRERDGYVPNVVYSCGSQIHNWVARTALRRQRQATTTPSFNSRHFSNGSSISAAIGPTV